MLRSTAELALEERVTREPYSLQSWLAYLRHLSSKGTIGALFCVYERAVAALPGSYKLWRAYAHAFRKQAAGFHPAHEIRTAALRTAERAARAMRVSPVLWTEYVKHAAAEGRWTEMRQALNDALRLLPALQHDMVWHTVLENVAGVKRMPGKLKVLLLRRYAKLRPGSGREQLYRTLAQGGMWDEAVAELCAALEDPDWLPKGEFTREQLWMELARTAAKHPKKVVSTDVPKLLKGAIRDARTDIGELWVVFGEYFIRKGLFEDARNVYEEAVTTVTAVRDFAVVFDAYAKFEESLVSAAIEDVETIKEEIKEDGEDETLMRELKDGTEMVELLIARLEYLTNRRPMLLSDVWLRQNPHNVHEWHKRARMFKQAKDAVNAVDTYTKAVQTVDPWRATNGRPHTLWLAFARYYEDSKELTSARRVLDKAVSDPEQFRSAEDLAAVWSEYAEMELRCNTIEAAREVLLRATTQPEKKKREEAARRKGETKSNIEAVIGAGAGNQMISHEYDSSSPAWNVYKSMRVWHFLIDLTHSISTPEQVIQMHDQIFDLHIASPQTVLSGAAYLESNRLFEQSFRLYDKGASVISWPAALEIWVVYLTKFVNRYGSRKLERARDLFEEAIRSAPSTRKGGREYPHPQLRLLYIMYAQMEEKHSLARHSLRVLDRATKSVQESDRADMFRMYIVKIATLFGVTKTRPIYEEAMTTLTSTEEVLDFSTRYAAMETRVGEVDRARGVFRHACAVADPRRGGMYKVFWRAWDEFELAHGSEDSFRDMLREKRRVQLNFKGIVLDADVLLADGTDGGNRGIQNMVKAGEIGGDAVGNGNDNGEVGAGSDGNEGANGAAGNSGEIENKLPGKDGEEKDKDEDGEEKDKDEDGEEKRKDSDGGEADAEGTTEEDANRTSEGKLRIVEKEVPESLRRLAGVGEGAKKKSGGSGLMRLMAAAREAQAAKRKAQEDVDGGKEGEGVGALARLKRRKQH